LTRFCAFRKKRTTTSAAQSERPPTKKQISPSIDCTTPISFPFLVSLYGTTYNSARVSSNGNLQFTGDSQAPGNECPLPSVVLDAAIQPFQGDLRTDAQPDCSVFSTGCGVFTSVAGTAPNRIFYIEWRTTYVDRPGTADFEVALYENNSSFFDVLYEITADMGSGEVSGVQASNFVGPATTFSCLEPTLANGLKVTYTCTAETPTPTPTPTSTPTPNATPTPRPTPTPRR
jgi:hypothetical protein